MQITSKFSLVQFSASLACLYWHISSFKTGNMFGVNNKSCDNNYVAVIVKKLASVNIRKANNTYLGQAADTCSCERAL